MLVYAQVINVTSCHRCQPDAKAPTTLVDVVSGSQKLTEKTTGNDVPIGPNHLPAKIHMYLLPELPPEMAGFAFFPSYPASLL
jgi:hypothetical protein